MACRSCQRLLCSRRARILECLPANAGEAVHTENGKGDNSNFDHPRALKLRRAMRMSSGFLNMFCRQGRRERVRSRMQVAEPDVALMQAGGELLFGATRRPTGNSAKPVKPRARKYFALSEMQLSVWFARLTRSRGAAHRHGCCGEMRWTLIMQATNACDADGEVVWS
jgi:hypothetical protein